MQLDNKESIMDFTKQKMKLAGFPESEIQEFIRTALQLDFDSLKIYVSEILEATNEIIGEEEWYVWTFICKRVRN